MDRPDDEAGYQVHVVYAIPKDGTDRAYDTNGTLNESVHAFDDWFLAETGKQRVRLDRSGGSLDITFVKLDQTDKVYAANRLQLRDALERELKSKGFRDAKKLYALYYDGTSPDRCGGGPWPPDLPGNVAALYLQGTPNCDLTGWTPDGAKMTYREFAMIHEIFHALGFMPRCAPHQTLAGHSSYSPWDLMYSGDGNWDPRRLDLEDELYDHKVAGCLDLKNSAFLTPSAADAAPPPLWDRSIAP